MEINKVWCGDWKAGAALLPTGSVNTIVTSPPYYGLRDYGHPGQLGHETSPDAFIAALVDGFRLLRRGLKDDGTVWVNLGDSYAGANSRGTGEGQARNLATEKFNGGSAHLEQRRAVGNFGADVKAKDLIGIPWAFAFAMRQPWLSCDDCKAVNHASAWGSFPNGRKICPLCEKSKGHEIETPGWYLRQDIIWSKPNPMPESVTDRCTKSHEYIFLLSKSPRYYFDANAIKEPIKTESVQRIGAATVGGSKHKNLQAKGQTNHTFHETRNRDGKEWDSPDGMANKRSVWNVPTTPYADAHFATFPQKLIVDCIKAGCPPGGTVLDPFSGAGTTALVSRKLNRNFYAFELNPDYVDISEKRLAANLGMFL